MDTNPLVTEEIEAASDLIQRFRNFLPVVAAFWLNPSEDGKWALYIAAPEIDNDKYDLGFGEILRLVREMRTPYIDPFQVRLINRDDPLAEAAIEINQRFPGPIPTRLRGKNFGGIPVQEVYIYPAKDLTPVS
jgi:hypothetical protein